MVLHKFGRFPIFWKTNPRTGSRRVSSFSCVPGPALVTGWGKVEKALEVEADEELWHYYSTEGYFCVKTEEDQDNGW